MYSVQSLRNSNQTCRIKLLSFYVNHVRSRAASKSTIPLLIQLINQPIFLIHVARAPTSPETAASTTGRCIHAGIRGAAAAAAAESGSSAVEEVG